MRFINGDNQHGGHYGCLGHYQHLSMCHNLNYMAQRKYRTLTEQQQQVLVEGKGKEAKQLLDPFKDLQVNEL